MRVGVLALQGDFAEHIAILRRLEVETFPVRLPAELKGVDGLIIPGGESTTISRLMRLYQLEEPVKELAKRGVPLWGTCAGMILVSKKVSQNSCPEPLGLMEIEVRRNAFGRQVDSFETLLEVPALGKKPFPAVFIRAPYIEKVGRGVEVLAKLDNGVVVAARQGKLLVTAFHPELTKDLRFHAYFLKLVVGR